MTQAEFDNWLSRLLASYPDIIGVALIGSRAVDQHNEDSDWDVVLKLRDSCYQPAVSTDLAGIIIRNVPGYQQIDKIEQRIAFDPDLCELDPDENIDLFFLRPDGQIGQWSWYDLDALVEETAMDSKEYLIRILEAGMSLVKLGGDPGTIELAYALFGRIHERDEKRIRKQFKRAKVLYPGEYLDGWLR